MRRLERVSIIAFLVCAVILGIFIYREKIIKDQTGPVFSMDSNTVEMSVKDDESELLKGISAADASDGDVTDSIIVETISPFTGTGRRIVNYVAFDSDNNVTHAKRELIYTDYTPPRFHISKPLSFTLNATNLLDGITVEDCIDGDISRNIRMMSDSEIDTAHIGEYKARLKVTNSAGAVSYLPVTIEIYDAATKYRMPQLNLTHNIVYVDKGSYFDENDYLESLIINGTEYSFVSQGGTYGKPSYGQTEQDHTVDYDEVDIESEVDTDITGCYEVTYTFEDSEYSTGSVTSRLYVVVTEEGSNADNE